MKLNKRNTERLARLYYELEAAKELKTRPEHIRKLPQGFIQNREESVIWNEEFVLKNNRKYVLAVSDMQRKRDKAINAAEKRIAAYIAKIGEFPDDGGQAIYEMANKMNVPNKVKFVEELIHMVTRCQKKEDK